MKLRATKILLSLVLLAVVLMTMNCGQNTNSNQNATPTPAANSTPEDTRGCPAGTKACGDACIPKKQSCGGK